MFKAFFRSIALLAFFGIVTAGAQTTWTNTGNNGMWTNSTTWVGPAGGYPNGVDSVALFNGASLVASQSKGITNDVSITNGSLVFVNTTNTGTGFNLWTNNGNGRLYLDVSTGNALVANATNVGSGTQNIIMPVTLLDPLVVSNNGTLNFAGDVSNGGYLMSFYGVGTTTISRPVSGAGGIAKSDAGNLILSAVNAYSGPTTLNGGRLTLSTNSSAGIGVITNNAPGGLIVLGAPGNYTNNLVLNSNLMLASSIPAASKAQGWLGTISGSGQLTVSNFYNVALTNNSHAGGTVLDLAGNTVTISDKDAFGTGTVRVDSAVNFATTSAFTLTNSFLVRSTGVAFTTPGVMLTFNGVWDLSGTNVNFYSAANGSGIHAVFNGGITNGNNVAFIKSGGSGFGFILGGSNSWSGNTLVHATTVILTNLGTIQGSTNVTVAGGYLTLADLGAPSAVNRLVTNAVVSLSGSTLTEIGPGTAGQVATQRVGAISVALGANILTITNRGTFVADSFMRNAGATLNVTGTNAPTVYVANTPPGATNGIVPWAVINAGANGFAGWSGSALTPYAGYTNALVNDPTANVRIGAATLAASSTINSLWVSNSAAPVNLGGNTLAITSGGLLFGTNTGSSVSNGVVNFGSAEGAIFNQSAASIYAALGGSAGISKSGAGSLSLLGTNTYAGDTWIDQGTLVLQGGAISNGGNLVVLQGATFQMLGGSADVNSLQLQSNWYGAAPSVTLGYGSLTTRSNSPPYLSGTIGQSLTAPMAWTMLGGSNYVSASLGTNATLRASGSGTILVLPVSVGGGSNVVSVESGAAFTTAGTVINILGSNNVVRLDGTNTTGTFGILGLGGVANVAAKLLVTNAAILNGGRLFVGSPQNDFTTPATNAEVAVFGSTFNLSGGAGALFVVVGGATNASGNHVSLRRGSMSQMSGGAAASYLTVGRGASASSNLVEVAEGSSLRFSGGGAVMTGLLIGNTNAGGSGNAFILRGGSLFELYATSGGTNLVVVSGAGNVVSNIGSTFQLAGSAATIGAWFQTDTSGSIVFTNAILSWRNRADAYVTPILAGTTLTNITWQGDNGFMLNGATNATGLAAYTFDSVATTLDPTQFQRLLLTGTNSLWRSARLNVAAGGAIVITNAVNATVQGITTNAGTISVINSTVTWRSNTVVSGLYYSDPSTNTFATNLTVTSSGALHGSNGDLFVLYSDFVNQSTNRSQFNLAYASVLFTNGNGAAATNHTLNLQGSTSVDMGSNWLDHTQLATNFSIGTLTVAAGNRLTLTGDKGTNALYVGWLDLSAWSTNASSLTNTLLAALSLPNINLYYDKYDPNNAYLGEMAYDLSGWGAGHGLLIPIPEPSIWLAMGGGLALLAFLRRRTAA